MNKTASEIRKEFSYQHMAIEEMREARDKHKRKVLPSWSRSPYKNY